MLGVLVLCLTIKRLRNWQISFTKLKINNMYSLKDVQQAKQAGIEAYQAKFYACLGVILILLMVIAKLTI